MTSQGSPQSRLQRALKTRSVFLAEIAVREMGGRASLAEALELVLLYAELDPKKLKAASRRWLVRFVEETAAGAEEIAIAATALSALRGPSAAVAVSTLRALEKASARRTPLPSDHGM